MPASRQPCARVRPTTPAPIMMIGFVATMLVSALAIAYERDLIKVVVHKGKREKSQRKKESHAERTSNGKESRNILAPFVPVADVMNTGCAASLCLGRDTAVLSSGRKSILPLRLDLFSNPDFSERGLGSEKRYSNSFRAFSQVFAEGIY